MLFVLVMLVIYLNISYFSIYNTELFHPMFGTLLPLTLLLFLAGFLKNIKPKLVFLTVIIFGVIDFILLSKVEPLCSGIVCFDRTLMALVLSSLFSVIYFIVLLFQNKKNLKNK